MLIKSSRYCKQAVYGIGVILLRSGGEGIRYETTKTKTEDKFEFRTWRENMEFECTALYTNELGGSGFEGLQLPS
jgi:hypothetical protein